MKTIVCLFALLNFYTITPNAQMTRLSFLAGIWKMEGKSNYEEWTLKSDGSLQGSSYKIVKDVKKVSEYLTLRQKGNKVIYTAQVIDQNNGQPVNFVWNSAVRDKFSFENAEHDFPKKVQYKVINDSTLYVNVLGDNDKGFSYRLIKQHMRNIK